MFNASQERELSAQILTIVNKMSKYCSYEFKQYSQYLDNDQLTLQRLQTIDKKYIL